jgi:hypothetical protein
MSTNEELEKAVEWCKAKIATLEDIIKKDVAQPLKEHTEAIAEHAKKITELERKQDAK